MIGVIANPSEHAAVCEFFELFKTPWEYYRRDRRYQVLLCAGDGEFQQEHAAPQLVVVYAGQKLRFDAKAQIETAAQRKNACVFSYRGTRIPIYGDSIAFPGGSGILLEEESGQPALHSQQPSGKVVARIGYDLFAEVRALLAEGQPPANAGIPALELHIALLRDLIVASGAQLVEIPPIPEGYRFIACLTHDVDHPSIRRHKFDHTMFGFLYRALLGSLFKVFRGRAPWRSLLTNWAAALKLPLVYLGLAKDFWLEFESYPEIERGLRSSFFVIPFEGDAGRRDDAGPAPKRRASGYGAADIAPQMRKLMSAGCEIGLHGIDAWRDSSNGCEELEQIRRITGMRDIGVRMHWLYFDERSPVTLERAGADYDSTMGYNGTVGYRAGTTQAYKPLQAARLLELPLHIMDTALFYPSHLDLSPKEASKRVGSIIDNAVQFGGSVTVNWHDRSILPERCWGDFYIDLVAELESKGAWFATAAETVAWFRKRRSARFENAGCEPDVPHVKIAGDAGDNLPALHLQVHEARQPTQASGIGETVSALAGGR
jgi:hypothetical protein